MTGEELTAAVSASVAAVLAKSDARWSEEFGALMAHISTLMAEIRQLERRVDRRTRDWRPLPERPACPVVDIVTRKVVAS